MRRQAMSKYLSSRSMPMNDKPALTNNDWNEASKANITALLKPGSNWIRAEAENEGGPAGFIARLTFKGADGKVVRAWRGVKVPGHVEEVLQAARSVQS